MNKLQNRALTIINFEDSDANANYLHKNNEIHKLDDFIKLQNILPVHDYLNEALPNCFNGYYLKLNFLYFNAEARNSTLGCLFTPSRKTTKYGLNSITQQCIFNRNYITKTIQTDLLSLSRNKLRSVKKIIFRQILKLVIQSENILYTCICPY